MNITLTGSDDSYDPPMVHMAPPPPKPFYTSENMGLNLQRNMSLDGQQIRTNNVGQKFPAIPWESEQYLFHGAGYGPGIGWPYR